MLIRGVEVLDLTDPANVKLFRKWDQKEAAYIEQLRYIRINSDNVDVVVLSKPGKHPSLVKPKDCVPQDTSMVVDTREAPLLLEPLSRFSSTIMGMDEIPAN